MAIFHFTAKVVSRKAGQSAVAKAAYISRSRLTDERDGEARDFSRAEGLIFSGIFAPKDAPEWAHDRERLWNEAERAEKRKDATIAREYEIALPYELTDEQHRELVRDFVRENFMRKGYAADVAIHAPDKEGDKRNYHAHILVTDRRLEADGFADDKKERKQKSPDRKAELEHLRERWETTTNRYLERHGHEIRIDRRTLEAQGIEREPEKHLGPTATQLEREGQETERGNLNREIKAQNQEREQLEREGERVIFDRVALERQQREQQEREGERAIFDRVALEAQQREVAREQQKAEREREERQKDSREKKEQQEQKPVTQTVEKAIDRTIDLADGLLDFFVGSTPKPKRQHEPERAKEEPKREAPTVEKALDRTIDAMDGLLDFFVGSTPKPKRQQQEEPNRHKTAAELNAEWRAQNPHYKTAAELHAQARARSIAEAERRKSLTPEQRREEDRQREEERARERERDRERGGRSRERER